MPVRMPPVLRRRRYIEMKGASSEENLRHAQQRAAVRHIEAHPEFEFILHALREGIAASDIARHFAMQEMLTVTERTFLEYLYVFKALRRELIYRVEDPASPDVITQVRGGAVEVDVDIEMDRAIRLQRTRVGMAFNTEKSVGLLLGGTHKEVEVLGKFLELKAKRKGLLSVTKALASNNSDPTVRDTLDSVKKTEGAQDKLFELTRELVKAKHA